MEPKLTFNQWVYKLSKRYYYRIYYTDSPQVGILGYKIIESKEQSRDIAISIFKTTYPNLVWVSATEVDESYKDRHLTFR